MLKASEHLRKQGNFAKSQIRRTDNGYEQFGWALGLGKAALSCTGTHIGNNDGQPMTLNGEPVEVDADHPITQIALRGRTELGVANDIVVAANGGDTGLSDREYYDLGTVEWRAAHRTGTRILSYLHNEENQG